MIVDTTKVNPYIINDFSAGMRMSVDPCKLGQGEYYFLSNGRVRINGLKPVKLPALQSLPAGTIQGIKGVGSILLVMVNGYLHYRDYAGTFENFSVPPSFQGMDSNAPVWIELVPASNLNYQRVAASSNPREGTFITEPIVASPRAVLIQNGYERPRIVLSSGTSRRVNDIQQWTVENREYVPVGKYMFYHPGNGVLYIVSPDGTEIYRSVSGRPLDFVIAIDEDGDRLKDGLYTVEASRLSHKFGYSEITCISGINYKSDNPDEDPPFFVGTENGSVLIFPLLVDALFGETERFRNVTLFPTGPRNQFSFIEMLGDYGFISPTGPHSFNAISQFQNEGKNSPFAIDVAPLFEGITTQDVVCAASFDNYALFSVATKFGNGILVFDPIIKKFVSFDIYPGIGKIKQFADLLVNGVRRLFFYDDLNNLYEAFAGETAEMLFYPREWSSGHLRLEQRVSGIQIAISNIRAAGTIQITDYADTKRGSLVTKQLQPNVAANTIPITPPYGSNTTDTIRNPTISMDRAKRGWKVGVEIKLNTDAEIQEIQVLPEEFIEQNPEQERAEVYAS